MKLVHKVELDRNENSLTSFARKMATAESRSRYRDWRGLEMFRDFTPGQIETLRHMSPQRQLKWGRKRRVPNWITAA